MSLECCLTAGIRWTAVKTSVTHDDDLPGIARPAAAVFSSLSAMAAGVIIHRALRPTPARMELHPLRQYWLEPRAINIAPLATSTVLFYRTIIIGRSDGTVGLSNAQEKESSRILASVVFDGLPL